MFSAGSNKSKIRRNIIGNLVCTCECSTNSTEDFAGDVEVTIASYRWPQFIVIRPGNIWKAIYHPDKNWPYLARLGSVSCNVRIISMASSALHSSNSSSFYINRVLSVSSCRLIITRQPWHSIFQIEWGKNQVPNPQHEKYCLASTEKWDQQRQHKFQTNDEGVCSNAW